MKTIIVKCARCGKELPVNLKNAHEEVECTHCHKKSVLSKKSRNLVLFARYLCVAILCFVLMFLMAPLQQTNKLLFFVGVFVVGVLVASTLEKYCIKVAFFLFKLDYIDVDEEKRLEAEALKKKLLKKAKK